MNLDYINRIVKTSLILAAVIFPFLGVYVRISFGIAYILGCIWGCLNLIAIRFLITQVITPDPKNNILIAIIILVKFPVIYGLGYLLVIWDYLPLAGLVWGFSSLLIVTVLKVVSRSLLHLQNRRRKYYDY
jgi:hypothetical protein